MSTNQLSLEDRIHHSMRLNADQMEFVPADTIEALTSKPIIEEGLKKYAESLYSPELISYVLDPQRPAKKVFLILVICNAVSALGPLSESGFHDKHLPIKMEQVVDKATNTLSYVVRSSEIDSQPSWDAFGSWKKIDICSFDAHQWRFLAPVFTLDKFYYRIHRSCPLPVVTRGSQKDGFFSSVFEVRIHDAHQQVLPMVKQDSKSALTRYLLNSR